MDAYNPRRSYDDILPGCLEESDRDYLANNIDRAVALLDLPRCVYPGCLGTRRTRGLCHGHYQVMRDRVRKGRVTEASLMARGLLLPSGTGGFPARDALKAFEEGSTVRGDAGVGEQA